MEIEDENITHKNLVRQIRQASNLCKMDEVLLVANSLLTLVDTEFSSRAEGTRASRKGLLDGARDPPSFSAWVLPDSPECAALRADMKGDRLNSRFQLIHKNKSVKAHAVV